MRYTELALSAQTAYAELFEQTRTLELTNALACLVGSFHKLTRKGQDYWYFAYRELGQKVRMAYVGPDDKRVRVLVERFRRNRRDKPLAPMAQVALGLGCVPTAPKHFRIVRRLAECGLFRAGGVLIGTHAFLALGNLLGVRWQEGASTLDVDFAHAGRNISVALPADLHLIVHGALESLEMGLLPLTEFSGKAGAQYRNPEDQELRLDFVTSATRGGRTVVMPELNLALEPLRFMEFLLQGTTQGCVIGRAGACVVNLPAPERYAVHKLILYGERPVAERAKAAKDLLQAAGLADHFVQTGQARVFNTAWRDALGRGRGWLRRSLQGMKALLRIAPELDVPALWKH
jgi:hypothetical protein